MSRPGLQEQTTAVKEKGDLIHEDECAVELLPVSKADRGAVRLNRKCRFNVSEWVKAVAGFSSLFSFVPFPFLRR